MSESISEVLSGIQSARIANEAEVETKVLLHIFRLLGFRDVDRADKPSVTMHFGHETKHKQPDFVLYDGPERSLTNALIAVEAKSVSNSLEGATNQAKSYALWAGTPFYLVSNGVTLKAVQFIPAGNDEGRILEIRISQISSRWPELFAFLNRKDVIIAKERLAYLSCYLPQVELLPASEFFSEYLTRLSTRFSTMTGSTKALVSSAKKHDVIPSIPVTTRLSAETGKVDLSEVQLANQFIRRKSHLFLQGVAGSGKSTLCKRVVNRLAAIGLQPGANLLPIYIPLSRFIPDSIPEALSYACKEMGVRVFPSLFGESLKHSRILLVLDGLDEVQPRDRIRLRRFTREKSCNVLITTRPLETEHLFEDINFDRGIIRNLTDSELWTVLSAYMGGSSQVVEFLKNINPTLKSSLKSPLFALMTIGIAQRTPHWQSLSTFELFERYVLTLHQFFNDEAMSCEAGVPSTAILGALSEVACHLQTLEPAGVPLSVLADYMQAVGQSQGFGVLLNIGLVSTAGGRAILSHQAFQEFGISLRMLHSIRANDARSFLGSGPSDFVYQLVSGGVTRNDEAQLVHWLSECDKRVRRRALKILRYGASSPALDLITSELETEKSTEVWAASVYTLIAHHDERFLETVFSSLEHLSPQRQRILARAFRSSNHHGYVTWAIRLAEERKRHSLTVSAFEISLRANAIKEADRLADLYLVQALSTRRKLCRLFNEHRTGSLAEVLSIRLLPFELSAELLTYLLNRIGNHLNDSPPAHLIHACSVLSEVKNLDKNARRRLRSIAASLKQPGEGSDVNQHLLSLCEDLGRYRKKLI